MSVILYEYKEFEGVYNELVKIPELEKVVMNNDYVKRYNSQQMPISMKYKYEDALGRLMWYMYVANRVAFSLQYQENEKIFTPEQSPEKYTLDEAKQKFGSFIYNIYTNNGTVFLSQEWLGLAMDIKKFIYPKDFAQGGTLPTPFGQAGLVGETGTMNEIDLFAMGGDLPQGVHQYYGQTYNPAYPTPHGYAKGGKLRGFTANDPIYTENDISVQRVGGSTTWNVAYKGKPKGRVLDAFTKEQAVRKFEKTKDDYFAKGGEVKYGIVDDNSNKIYFKSTDKKLVDLKLKEFQEIYPNDKIIIEKFAKGGIIKTHDENHLLRTAIGFAIRQGNYDKEDIKKLNEIFDRLYSSKFDFAKGGDIKEFEKGKFLKGKQWNIYKGGSGKFLLEKYKGEDLVEMYVLDTEEKGLAKAENEAGYEFDEDEVEEYENNPIYEIVYEPEYGGDILVPEDVQLKVISIFRKVYPNYNFGDEYENQIRVNQYSTLYAKGGRLKSFLGKAKKVGGKAYEKGREIAHYTKEKTKEGIHNASKINALGVLNQMKNHKDVSFNEVANIEVAEDVVLEHYQFEPTPFVPKNKMAKGGDVKELRKISKELAKSVKSHDRQSKELKKIASSLVEEGMMAKGGKVESGDKVILTTDSLGKKYKGMMGEITSRKLLNDLYSVKLENGLTVALKKGDFRHNSINPKYAKGGKTQGFNDKLDESLGNTKGKRSNKEQNYKDRRDESEAMEKKEGRRKYARVKTMDKNRRKRKTPMTLAKEIRKDGEKWIDAVKRASAMIKNK